MKTAIVTGGAHGIGKAIVLKLLKDGCSVIILDSNEQQLISIKEELKLMNAPFDSYVCNVGDPDTVKSVMSKIGDKYKNIDYLVNNAGISVFESIETMSVETWNKIISVNLSGMFYCIKFAIPFLSERSAVVNIASTRAFMSEPHNEAYGASKGGIVALTHALAISLGPKTRVNCVSPGWIEINDYANLTKADHEQHPAGRVGMPDDIAEAVAFLLSDRSEFITGQNMIVDGGMTKKMIYI